MDKTNAPGADQQHAHSSCFGGNLAISKDSAIANHFIYRSQSQIQVGQVCFGFHLLDQLQALQIVAIDGKTNPKVLCQTQTSLYRPEWNREQYAPSSQAYLSDDLQKLCERQTMGIAKIENSLLHLKRPFVTLENSCAQIINVYGLDNRLASAQQGNERQSVNHP